MTDGNLLFGVLALHADLIDSSQFADACAAWATRKDTDLSAILIERGWITEDDKRDVEKLVSRKLKRHGGDVRASLAASADPVIRQVMQSIDDPDLQQTVDGLPPVAGHVILETLVKPTETRSRYSLSRVQGEGGLGRVWVAR